VVIRNPRPIVSPPPAAAGTAGLRGSTPTAAAADDDDAPTMELQVPAPNELYGQLVLSVSETDVTTWTFATLPAVAAAPPGARELDELHGGASGPTRGVVLRTYLVPSYGAGSPASPATAETTTTRGLVSAVGTRLLKVLIFPLLDPLIGKLGEAFAGRWEAVRRPYGLRSFTPADYAQPGGTPLDADAVRALGKGRALLMVHGTFSRANTAFGGLPPDVVSELHRLYAGRVFAFDHFTLSEDPEQNVRWLVEHLPADAALDLDIVCHSRGGLVSRALAEKQSALSLGARNLRVRNVVFVAAPNAGTALADGDHMGDLIDSYTNLLNFFPATGVSEVLEGVVSVAKMLSVGALKGLPGLQAMAPHGGFLSAFNTGPKGADHYYAMAAEFQPTQPGLEAWARNRLMNAIFRHAANDLVVPTLGVYAENGSGSFPIADRRIFPPASGISHGGYFAAPEAQRQILAWLGAAVGG
jgi:hypothetical protein